MTARVLMIQGTTSSAGKSLLTAALCRIYARRGVAVAPFKAQNMSNNAAICPDGAEIGRSTAVQALACGLAPSADMNPVLLKPEGNKRSQIIVNGRPLGHLEADSYYERKRMLWQHVTAALDRLRQRHELVIIEGAGSPVELNLSRGDIVNMAVARYAQAPVLLVGDIDRGGVFAQLLGTLWLLAPEERALVKGLIVNKFRGDLALFADGVAILQEKGGVPVLGVVPWIKELRVPEEDAVALDDPQRMAALPATQIDIAAIHLPLIANFDDLDALDQEPGVRVRYVQSVEQLGRPQAIILPGTKGTMSDLGWLKRTGLAAAIRRLAGEGVAVVGICGGYQMLGQVIQDPQGVESPVRQAEGLGLLPIETVFADTKETHQVTAHVTGQVGWLATIGGHDLTGYEIHMGRTGGAQPFLTITQRSGQPVEMPDGAMSPDGRVWGCYLHGTFDNLPLRRAWLASLGWQEGAEAYVADGKAELERLADAVEATLDMALLERIVWPG